jgi:molybdopterin-containing oxidoreductase family iron-sulfur binding subunit
MACKAEYDLPPKGKINLEQHSPLWSKVYTMGPNGAFPDLRMYYLPVLCNHCEKPRCLESCPVGAITKKPGGVVLIDQETCNGCQRCYWACPYSAVFCPERKQKASKCTFCFERLEKSEDPLCVSVCLAKSRIFGDLSDPMSKIRKKLEKNQERRYRIPVPPHIDLGPRVYYLLR